ncbi:membrane integrity-associated transporter subunit PqiC [Sphingomonas sabuli]|uniref:Membrane integrity-associated transporter subunit PqiC n=1 Tax=Sphingomonas sabuli TaxID=2764186 RepID=A0A7G9L1A8_9SPHN|nr:ABC-type transport auxiliary lipoprotein family protein [Sphingomonas sabuli]QNM82407.1 membrane integrity-associated transporter subunit PqiC [Sphingomonas sabuli]
MTRLLRIGTALALAASVCGCSLLGGGKTPDTLYTLTPEAPFTAQTRSVAVGQTVTIRTPVVPKELRVLRVPVQVSPTNVEYVTDLQWVDTPDKLFQKLVEETVRRKTARVVLDPAQASLDPGLVVTGELNRFGYDAQTGMVVVQYDAAMATQGGTHVENRRFESTIPSSPDAANVGTMLNAAANRVATEVAAWIGG